MSGTAMDSNAEAQWKLTRKPNPRRKPPEVPGGLLDCGNGVGLACA